MGDLTIRILEARNLIPADRNGKSDPYVTVEILEDPMQKKQKTRCHHKTLNPVWQETFNFRAPASSNTILFKVWDRDLFKHNDPLGNVNIPVTRLAARVPNNMWLDLQGVPSGKLHVEIIFVPHVQAGGMNVQQPTQYAQQPYQQAPMQQAAYYAKPQYPQASSYTPNPVSNTQSYPTQQTRGINNNPSAYPLPQSNIPTNSAARYASQPGTLTSGNIPVSTPTNSGYPTVPTGYSTAPVPSTYPTTNPANASVGYPSAPVIDNDVAVDYTKLVSDFNMMNTSASNYSQQPNYTQQANYSTQQLNYPQQQQPNYLSQPNYPPQQQQQQQQPVYSQQPSYPQQQQGYPSQQAGHPQQQTNYPPQAGYPLQQAGYPPQQQNYQAYPPKQQTAYPQHQAYAQQAPVQGASLVTAQGLVTGPKLTKFFVDIKKRLNRDYIVIMDMSGSMSGKKWEQAKDATMKIAPFACQGDPDGITLYLFNGRFSRHNQLQQAGQVHAIFSREKPSGTTNLAGVLQSAFAEHFSGSKPTTILVITDGEPDSEAATIKEIVQASHKLQSQEDLSISFIQIGNDRGATKFLQFLDDSLKSRGAKFDIVDALSANDLGTMTFDQLIEKSIYG